jgi:hypothetical protein
MLHRMASAQHTPLFFQKTSDVTMPARAGFTE